MASLYQEQTSRVSFISHPILFLIVDHIFGKKTQVFSKTLPVMHIFSFTIISYLEKFIGIKSLNKKQCQTGLSPIIIPSPPISHLLPKDNKLKWF